MTFLNGIGFKTVDSGDGSNFENGMECAVPYPMLAIQIESFDKLKGEADRLKYSLEWAGVDFNGDAQIQASYDPEDGTCIILVTHILDEHLADGGDREILARAKQTG